MGSKDEKKWLGHDNETENGISTQPKTLCYYFLTLMLLPICGTREDVLHDVSD